MYERNVSWKLNSGSKIIEDGVEGGHKPKTKSYRSLSILTKVDVPFLLVVSQVFVSSEQNEYVVNKTNVYKVT